MNTKFTAVQILVITLIQIAVFKISMAQMPAAISIQPENGTFYDDLTLTFDPALACFESGTLVGFPYVAMHSGVTVDGTTWQYVVAFNSTGGGGQSPILNANPDGTFSITFNPFEFYQFPAGASVTHICAVFNNGSNWNQDGRDFDVGSNCKDFFIPVNTGSPYLPGLNSILPSQGIQGETLNVQIFGVNTHFDNGSTLIYLMKNLIYIDILTYYAVNDTLISATINIPSEVSTGFWSLNVQTPIDGLLTLIDAFKINSSGTTMPAAIEIYPPDATAYDELTLIFNPEEACFLSGSLVNSGQIFIHSGVAFNTGEVWQHVIVFNGAGANNQSPQLSDNGNGTWSITYTPADFYGFATGSVVTHICAVFNDGTWDKDGRDFEEGTLNCADFFIPLNFSTGIKGNKQIAVQLIPNPVHDILRVEADGDIRAYRIINILGESITGNQMIDDKFFEVSVAGLRNGLYFISIEYKNNQINIIKFLKQ